MATLNNNQVAAVLNAAFAQATGSDQIGTLDLEDIIDVGNDQTITGTKDQMTKALCNVLIKNWFTDSSYRSTYEDPFFQDAEAFGAITQHISIELPEAQDSHVWTDITSGTTTMGTYTIYLPVVHTQLYGKSISWEIPIAITEEQLATAFHSASELKSFVGYVHMCVDNAIVCHLKEMDRLNRNNFMAEKLAFAATPGNAGIHVINPVAEWAKHIGATETITVADFRNNKLALNWWGLEFKKYAGYMREMSKLFNTAGYNRFTPTDRLVLQVLEEFENDVLASGQSDTYHNEIVALPGHQTVPFWQGFGKTAAFGEVSHIDVEIGSDGSRVNQNNIVALMVDKWAIMHTVVSRRVAVKNFEPEAVIQTYNQFTDRYVNNLTMNGLVFQLKDYTPA